ncbi:MAG: Trk system potassium transporter TrkA [Chitinophagales bacterium]|nr:Trk system potassium transporter TrkA [Chitinophagales bacterium]
MRIVIAGAGDVGIHLAKLLAHEKQDTIIIDQDADRLQYVENHLDVFTIKGDATCPKILKEAKIDKTELFIAATSTEANNITSCIMAKKMGAKQTISRINNNEYLNKDSDLDLHDLGIDFMISPERLAAKEIQRLVSRHAFTDSFEFDEGKLHLLGIHLEAQSPLVGKQIEETAHLNLHNSFLPVAIKRKMHTIIPRKNTYFEIDDFVYFISKKESLDDIAKLSGRPKLKNNNIMILGASRIGVKTAKSLSKHYQIKLIEQDQKKCFDATDVLPNVLVIHGDGRDVELLKEEDISDMGIFIAVTGSSSTNIMACLVAKAHGVSKTIALVENEDYIQLSHMVGIDTMINKKYIAASNIFRHIRKGEVLSLTNLHGVEAEVLEFKVNKNSKVAKKPIRELDFPKNARIGGVVRNGVGMVTLGDFQIEEGDHVVVFAMNESIQKVENFFK